MKRSEINRYICEALEFWEGLGFKMPLAGGSNPGRRLRFKGAVAAIGAAVGCRTGEGLSRSGMRLFSERTSVVR